MQRRNICIVRILHEEKEKNDTEPIFKNISQENIPEIESNPYVQNWHDLLELGKIAKNDTQRQIINLENYIPRKQYTQKRSYKSKANNKIIE